MSKVKAAANVAKKVAHGVWVVVTIPFRIVVVDDCPYPDTPRNIKKVHGYPYCEMYTYLDGMK